MTRFHFNAAKPASGKTEHAIRYAIETGTTLRHKTLFIVQTTDLIDELVLRAHAMLDAQESDLPIRAIHGKTGDDGRVKDALLDHLSTTPHDEGEMLLITLAAFLDLDPFPNKHAWHQVFVDEAIPLFTDHSINLTVHHAVITARLKLLDPDAEFSAVKPAYGASVRDNLRDRVKRGDEVEKLLRPLTSRLVNANYRVWTHVPTWNAVIERTNTNDDPRLFIYSEVQPSAFDGFGRVTFMGAWLQNHAFFKLWSKGGATFDQDPYLRKYVRSRSWSREKDTIAYATERHWTGSYATGTKLDDGRTPLEHIDAYLRQELHGFGFGWTKNSHHKVSYDGTYIAPKVAGSNEHTDLECLVWLPAMLPHPNMWRFLGWRGLSDDDIRLEHYWLPLAQFMTRGADRDASFTGTMIKFVPDLPAARFLHDIFLSKLKRVGTIPEADGTITYTGKAGRPRGHPNRGGRPRSALSPEQRKVKRNARLRLKRDAAKAGAAA